MAANIVVSTPVVAAGGKTITATLSGGTGAGYGPASGVTGALFYKFNAERFHVASATISGTTITWTLDTVIPTGARYWDLSGSSNITDGGGVNTVVSQNTVQLTNNSTQVAADLLTAEDADFNDQVSVAGIDLTSPGALVYHVKVSSSGVSQFEFTTDATDLDMMIYTSGPTQPLSVYIGGVLQTQATVTDAGGVFNLMPILSGNSGSKAIKIIVTDGCYIATNATFRRYGGTTLTLPSGYGKSYPLKTVGSFIDIPAPWAKLVDGANLPCAYTTASDLPIGFQTTGGSGGATHTYRMLPITVIGSSISNLMLKPDGSLWLFMTRSGGTVAMVIDGTESATLGTLDNTGSTVGWCQAYSGLDATTINESATWTARRTAWGDGDSILRSESGTGTSDSRQGYAHLAATQLDMVIANAGVNGQGLQSATGLSSSAQAPTIVLIEWGTNNIQAGTAGATVTSTWQTLIGNARTKAPSARIIIQKIIPRTDSGGIYSAGVATYNGYMLTAVANVADGNLLVADVSTGLNMATGGIHSTDGLHPNATANAIMKNNLVPYLTATGFTTSGTTGTVTVTRASGTFNGTETVTVAASAGNVTATAASGSISGNGTGTAIVTPASGATAFTYVGSADATITYTNGQGWANPGTTSYTAPISSASPAGCSVYAFAGFGFGFDGEE